jgi:hypothetical protein
MNSKKFFRWVIPLLLSVGALQACRADIKTAQNWPVECVGRMQIQLPGVVDIAATFNSSVKSFKINQDRRLLKPSFPDGTPAPFAKSILISHPLTESEKINFLNFANAEQFEVVEQKPDGEKLYKFSPEYQRIELPAGNGIALRNKKSIEATYFVGDSLVKWNLDIDRANLYLKARPRFSFDVPKEPCLCLPYIFVPDDGKARRSLSMSYRLKDHPDIQITLTDSSAFKPQHLIAYGKMDEAEVKLRNANAEPDAEIVRFWHQTRNWAKKLESQWFVPYETRPVTMAGFEGRQSFVRLTVQDGTQNYGYYAVVRGNPDASVDTPDIRLFVEQDVKLAQGKTPLTKDQFIDMAQAIAKSVQRRPTVPN